MSTATGYAGDLGQVRRNGAAVKTAEVLDIIERLHRAAAHPDITGIRRYGRDTEPGGQSPAGVSLIYQSGSNANLWVDTPGKEQVTPAALPEVFTPEQYRTRCLPALKFLADLLDAAKPAAFRAWRTVGMPRTWLAPCALEIRCADGTTAYIRVTSGFGGFPNPDHDEFPDYVIPDAVSV